MSGKKEKAKDFWLYIFYICIQFALLVFILFFGLADAGSPWYSPLLIFNALSVIVFIWLAYRLFIKE